MRRSWPIAAGLVLLALLAIVAAPSAAAQGVVIVVKDPEGDDKGPGFYGYPAADVFKPGVFDLLGFTVSVDNKTVTFKFDFKNLGGNPWGGKNGFCLQQVHVLSLIHI